MAFTTQQTQGLDAAYARQQSGTANQTDLANLKYATGLGYKPTAPAAPAAPPPAAAPEAKPAPVLDASTGTVKASSALDFYNNRMDAMKPQYEQATQDLTKIQSDIASMKPIDYGASYSQMYQAQAAPVDANIATVSQKLTTLDDSLRKMEDDVRAEIGGRAPESVIQAEVARRSKPLLLERQTFADQLQGYQDQKNQINSQIDRQLGFQQQSYNDQLSLMEKKAELAKSTVETYNSLLEKGAAASDKEVDNFRSMFSTLLTNAPDVLKNATQEELNQLSNGFVSESLMGKIGDTIKEKQLAADAAKATQTKEATATQILTRAGVIKQNALAMGQIITDAQAIAQAQSEYAALNGTSASSGLGGGMVNLPIGNTQADQIAAAIKQVESGGNYNAKGGSGENGAYQFMPATWKGWAAKYLGDANAAMTPENQDFVAKSHIQSLIDQGYNAQQIALIWNGGKPVVKKGVNKYGVAYDSGAYADKVLGTLSKIQGSAQSPQPVQTTNTGTPNWKTGVDMIDTYVKRVYTGEMKVSDVPSSYQPIVQKQLDLMPPVGNANFKKMTQNERTAFQDVLNLQSFVDSVGSYRKTANDTGPLAAATNAARGWFNVADPDLLNLETVTENLKAQIQKMISGAALSEAEVARLQKFLPSVYDNDQIFDTKLGNLRKEYNDIMTNKAKTFGFKSADDFKNAMFGTIDLPGMSKSADMSKYDSNDLSQYE